MLNEPRGHSSTEHPPIDVIPGWTIYQRVQPKGVPVSLPIVDDAPGHWSPLCHWLLNSVSLRDVEEYNFYSAAHQKAAFPGFLLVTRLLPGTGGARRSLMCMTEHLEAAQKRGEVGRAKVHTTGGTAGEGGDEERDVEWVEMETGKLREHLEKDWGFKF